jgi:hypothetical protein
MNNTLKIYTIIEYNMDYLKVFFFDFFGMFGFKILKLQMKKWGPGARAPFWVSAKYALTSLVEISGIEMAIRLNSDKVCKINSVQH